MVDDSIIVIFIYNFSCVDKNVAILFVLNVAVLDRTIGVNDELLTKNFCNLVLVIVGCD